MFARSKENPILIPERSHTWENLKVYNPGLLYRDGTYHLWYNAVGGDWVLRIGHAESKDGIVFRRNCQPVITPDKPFDKNGVMDPRVTQVGDRYYMTYSADDGLMRKLALATSTNLVDWRKHYPILTNWDAVKAGSFRFENGIKIPEKPDRRERSKAGAIFSEIIDDKLWMIFGNTHLWLASSRDGINWEVDLKPFLSPRMSDYFDNETVQGGPPPLKTERGWLVFYHGRDRNQIYRLGYLVLDSKNPKKILFRSEEAVFEPEKDYERSGIVDVLPGGFNKMKSMPEEELRYFVAKMELENKMPRVIFCCGAALVDDTVRIYYGAADTVIGTATASLHDFLGCVSPTSVLP